MTSREAAQAALRQLPKLRHTLHWLDEADIIGSCQGRMWRNERNQDTVTRMFTCGFATNSKQQTFLLWGSHAPQALAAIDHVHNNDLTDEDRKLKLYPLVVKDRDNAIKLLSQLAKVKRTDEEEDQDCKEIYRNYLKMVLFVTGRNYLANANSAKTTKALGWDD